METGELSTSVLVLISGILIVGVAIAKFAEKYRMPHPIPLVITGLGLGRVLLYLNPETPLVQIAGFDFIAQLTLAAVLFYAGLTLNLRELRLSIVNVLLLATIGVLATALIGGFTIAVVTAAIGIPVGIAAFVIGAILAPTDPAALFSVLESGGVRVKRKLFSILEGEAVFNDATSVILVILVFEPIVIASLVSASGDLNWGFILAEFVASMGLGVVIGYLVAKVIGWAIPKAGDDTNVSILTATTPFLAYGVGELFTVFYIHPGALAAVFAGLFMANARRIGLEPLPQRSMRGVMKNVSFFFEIAVFVLLGYSLSVPLIPGEIDIDGRTIPAIQLLDGRIIPTETIGFVLAYPGVIVLGLLTAFLVIVVARPISVFLVTAGDRSMGFKERFFLSWAGIKGVASAALAAISVTVIIQESTLPSYVNEIATVVPTIYAIVFIVLFVSLVVQGLSTSYLANVLGLTEKYDLATEIIVHRNATRQALLNLVDQYTEGKLEAAMYSRLKAELEEEIYDLEEKLRRVLSERRARLQELGIREELFKIKMEFYENQFESEQITEGTFQSLKSELEVEIEEIRNRIRMQERIIPAEEKNEEQSL